MEMNIFSDFVHRLNLSNEIFMSFVHANNVNSLLTLQKGAPEMVTNLMIMI